MTPPLPLAAVEAVLTRPGGCTLPAGAYADDAVLGWELEHFYARSWVCVGRAEDLGVPGDQRALRIGRDGVLLVRGNDGRLRSFANVCRHRGHELLADRESARRQVVRCPYHAWVYDLEGRLRTASRFGDVPGFDAADHGLVPMGVAEWRGWVFVNASGDAEPFERHAGTLDDLVAAHEPERLAVGAARRYEVAANWKVIAENYHECYHCPSIHPELCRVTPPLSGDSFDPVGAWAGGSMELRAHAATMSLTGEAGGVVLRGLGERARREVLYVDLFPNLLISLHPDYVLTHRLEPLAAGRTLVECQWLFPPEALVRPGFDPSYAVDFWDLTNAQDWHACESVQRGVGSRGFSQGPLSTQEESLRRFLEMVARGYLGASR